MSKQKKHYMMGDAVPKKDLSKNDGSIDSMAKALDSKKAMEVVDIDKLIAMCQEDLEAREDRVIIFQDFGEAKYKSGLFKAEVSVHKPAQGTVMVVGPGLKNNEGWLGMIYRLLRWVFSAWVARHIELSQHIGEFNEAHPEGMSAMIDLQPGDRVHYGRYAGVDIEWGDKVFIIVRQSDIMLRERKKRVELVPAQDNGDQKG